MTLHLQMQHLLFCDNLNCFGFTMCQCCGINSVLFLFTQNDVFDPYSSSEYPCQTYDATFFFSLHYNENLRPIHNSVVVFFFAPCILCFLEIYKRMTWFTNFSGYWPVAPSFWIARCISHVHEELNPLSASSIHWCIEKKNYWNCIKF